MRDGEMWIVIPNWGHFQHYKDRTPKWIKNYVELMADDAYLGLSGHQRGVLHGLWLEYASSRCQLRVDTASLSRRLNLRVTIGTLEALNHAGFIRISASRPLAKPEAREEKRREEQNPPTPLDRGARRSAEQRRQDKAAAKPPRYLLQARAAWQAAHPDEREEAVRICLQGFTADELEIRRHLEALKEVA